jgi:hypothetical protein
MTFKHFLHVKNEYYSKVVCVESPLQLLAAIEYIHRFGNNSVLLIIRKNGNVRNDEMLDELRRRYNLAEPVILSINKDGNYLKLFFITIRLFFWRMIKVSPQEIVVGDLRSLWIQILLFRFSDSKVTLIDDGNVILEFVEKDLLGNLKYNFNIRSRILIKKRIQQLKKDEILFFTIFHSVITDRPKLCIENKLSFFRDKRLVTEGFKVTKQIFFIGSPLSEEGIISLQDELKLIEKCRAHFAEFEFFYVLHRRECRKKVLKLLPEREIVKFDLPLELQFLTQSKNPEVVCSIYSTALLSLSILFEDIKCYSFLPEDNQVYEKFRDDFQVQKKYYDRLAFYSKEN